MTKTELLDRCSYDEDSRVLLSRVMDRINDAENRSIPSNTPFLSPRDQASVCDLIRARGGTCRFFFYGGYEQAERRICVFLPDWQEESDLIDYPDQNPLTAIRATFSHFDKGLTHRDFLGALMGLGITREKIGDLLVSDQSCDIILLKDCAPIVLSQLSSAGRARLSLSEIPLSELLYTAVEIKEIHDTVQTLRLDAVLSSGFSISRTKAAEAIHSGRVEINHRPCEKPDRLVNQNDVLTCRGLGKCVLTECDRISKKGRIMITINRYL